MSSVGLHQHQFTNRNRPTYFIYLHHTLSQKTRICLNWTIESRTKVRLEWLCKWKRRQRSVQTNFPSSTIRRCPIKPVKNGTGTCRCEKCMGNRADAYECKRKSEKGRRGNARSTDRERGPLSRLGQKPAAILAQARQACCILNAPGRLPPLIDYPWNVRLSPADCCFVRTVRRSIGKRFRRPRSRGQTTRIFRVAAIASYGLFMQPGPGDGKVNAILKSE